jgi:DNA gyrase subunit A
MRGAYLDYAMSVIVARALPDVRDGLKPVHRRILYAMHDMGLRPDRPYKKSARIVGEVLGKYHPHGDSAVYDAMVRMAQDFSMRYMLVDGQGNFGSVDGDSAAAMRYTEARLAPIAMEMLADIEKDTVDFVDNFDGSLQEPTVLPARVPNLLVNGASGIAVGMATNIPPHNLAEVCDALSFLIDHYDEPDEISVDDLLERIPGPDFPTAGIILGTDGIRSAFATGRGLVTIRARAQIEEMRGNRHRIVVTELPYQVNKAGLVERIAGMVRSGRLKEIADLRDESGRQGMQLVIELKRGAHPRKVLNQLFKFTALQSTFGVNMLALVDNAPRVLPLKQLLQHYVEHRRAVITRRTRHDLKKARARAHVLEGLKIALDHLDAVIQTIRQSPSAEEALVRLQRRFRLTEVQARAILDLQLRRLAALERQKIEEEYTAVRERIAYLEDLLAHPHKILRLIQDDLREVKEKYGDARRTTILPEADADFDMEDLIPDRPVLISITRRGYAKRVPVGTYRAQRRGGRGVTGMSTREEDDVRCLFAARTLDNILFFTNKGKVYQQTAYEIPDASRQAKGIPLINVVNLSPGEVVTAALAVREFGAATYLTMATRNGRIKRVPLDQFASVRSSGLIAIHLEEGDQLRWVKATTGEQEIILVTANGQALRFLEKDVRPMRRASAGVKAIRLRPGDYVAAMDVVKENADLLIVTAHGYGKRTPLAQYRRQGRHGLGIRTLAAQGMHITGQIVDARVVSIDDEITCISAGGMVLRTSVKNISRQGRATRGVKLMNLREDDPIVSLALLNGAT